MRFDNDAEQIVIGAVIADKRILADLTVRPEDFYRPEHEQLWRVILDEDRAGRPITLVALGQRLVGDKAIRGIDAAYLHECASKAVVPEQALYNAKIMQGLARLRKVGTLGARLQQMAESTAFDRIDEIAEDIRHDVDAALSSSSPTSVITFADALQEAIAEWESPSTQATQTGWIDLDDIMNGGWRPGQLTVVGARPAVGKSLIASCAAVHAAAEGAGFFSLEMRQTEVVGRMAAATMGIDVGRINSDKMNDFDWQKISRLVGESADWPLYIHQKPRISTATIRSQMRTWARLHPLKLVIVDYLQLLDVNESNGRERAISKAAEDLKILAGEFDVHILALAQVNRNSATGMDRRPTMSQLRESGGIEAHADNVILLHRDDDEMPGEIELIFEKNRHGRTGKTNLSWQPHVAAVRDMYREATA